MTALTIPYGDHPAQFGRLSLPGGPGPHRVVMLIHGGFWKAAYGLDLMEPLAMDLVLRGHAVWNIEYRRVEEGGIGYPSTLIDVATATDHLPTVADDHGLDLDRLAVIGHSAGGHLALWVGSRHLLPDDAPGAGPIVMPRFVVGQAAVTDLRAAANDGLGTNATQRFLGGEPEAALHSYTVAQPNVGATPTLLVSGDDDENVPVSYTSRFAGTLDTDVVIIEGEDHFDVIDPTSVSWQHTIDALTRALS